MTGSWFNADLDYWLLENFIWHILIICIPLPQLLLDLLHFLTRPTLCYYKKENPWAKLISFDSHFQRAHFMITCLSYTLGCVAFIECDRFTRGHVLLKADSPSPRSWWLPTALQLGAGPHAHLLSLCWNFGLSFQRSCMCYHSHCESIYSNTLLCCENRFLEVLPTSSPYHVPPLLCNDPCALGRKDVI